MNTSLRRLIGAGAALTGGLVLMAACGSSGGNHQNAAAAKPKTSTSASMTISVRQASGVGKILIDSAGRTLYSAHQEMNGRISCAGDCVKIWIPVPATNSQPVTPSGLTGTFGTVKRPDTGKLQLTYNSSPLYTFALDSTPGQVSGNGVSDAFSGHHFTWQAAGSTAKPTQAAPTKGGSGNVYPNNGY